MSVEALTNDSSIKLLEPRINQALGNKYDNINAMLNQAAESNEDMSEIEMMQFNVAVSRFNTMITLASGIYKNLCDGEKGIAQKM